MGPLFFGREVPSDPRKKINMADYPKWIPNAGKGPAEILVNSEADHIEKNKAHYEDELAEKSRMPASVTDQLDAQRAVFAENLAAAVAEERERCAVLAESYGGKQGKSIAASIRGVKLDPEAEA